MKNKWKILAIVIVLGFLTFAYIFGQRSVSSSTFEPKAPILSSQKLEIPPILKRPLKVPLPLAEEKVFHYPSECEATWKRVLSQDLDEVISNIKAKTILFNKECESWEKANFTDAFPNCSEGDLEKCEWLVPSYRSNIVDAIYSDSIPIEDLPEEVLWHKMIARAFRPGNFSKDAEYLIKIADRAHGLNPQASWPLQVKHMYMDHIHADVELFIALADEFRKISDVNPPMDELQLERHIYTKSGDKERYKPVLAKYLERELNEGKRLAIQSELAWVEGKKSEAISYMQKSLAIAEDKDKIFALNAMRADAHVEPFTVRLNYQVYWITDPLKVK